MACLSRPYATALDDLPIRILSEFEDQPGLRLTFSQVQRLWNVTESECRDAVAYLLRSQLLRRDANGRYCLTSLQEFTPWISS
jgi:DNA-binding IclR family transcriptional regulator